MGYWAKINEKGVVSQVIVATKNHIEKMPDAKHWVETKMDGSIRKNYAGVGYRYDKELDAFIPPKIYDSWVFDSKTYRWVSPVEKPKIDTSVEYAIWDEINKVWVIKNEDR